MEGAFDEASLKRQVLAAIEDEAFLTIDWILEDHSAAGLTDDQMIEALTVLMLDLRKQGREEDEDRVMDVLDFLTGWGWNGGRVWKSRNKGS